MSVKETNLKYIIKEKNKKTSGRCTYSLVFQPQEVAYGLFNIKLTNNSFQVVIKQINDFAFKCFR